MHGYLYNGDDLWPKTVNLCARGRTALLDLDRGPGTSYELGLMGPAWEAHLQAVALDRDPARPRQRAGRTRFVYSWPVVSTAQTHRLRQAYAVALAAPRRALRDVDFWRQHGPALDQMRLGSYLRLRHPSLMAAAARPGLAPPAGQRALRRAAEDWARRLVIALLERLAYAARALAPQAGPASLLRDTGRRRLTDALHRREPGATAGLARYTAQLEQAARRAGLLFDARRFRAFHDRVLLASLGPDWRHGRVTADQLRSILAHLDAERVRFDATFGAGAFARAATQGTPPPGPRTRRLKWREGARRSRLRGVALRELARLEYILSGRSFPALPAARRHHGAPRLEANRRAYLALAAEIKAVRERLTHLARSFLSPAVRARLLALLAAGEPSLVVGSFYFETEHLLETTSGFTHVGLVKRLPDPKSRQIYLWVFDRVLGFHYAYPVSKLTNSIPVQALALSARVARRRRRYRWLALDVPRVFHLGQGRTSDRVTLVNLFAHVRELLRPCPALTTTPGFYFAGMSWLIHHPRNKAILRDLWASRTHTGYGYQTLDPRAGAAGPRRPLDRRLSPPAPGVDPGPKSGHTVRPWNEHNA
jgi:hypothetical protein